jgi:hypothetical protein
MRTLIAVVFALALTGGAAFAQQWNSTSMPLGGGMYSNQATGPNGQSASGTTMPLGGGMSTTNWSDNQGHSTTCTTMPLGGGMSTTTCQ